MSLKITLIAAMARNRVVGVENRLPWSLPEDLKRFRALTTGHPIVMGRKTYESIGKPLPNRLNVVVSRKKDYVVPGVTVVPSVEAALEVAVAAEQAARSDGEVFVIGGGEIWGQCIDRADRIYLTVIDREFEGDCFFPAIPASFREITSEARSEPMPFRFVTYEKK